MLAAAVCHYPPPPGWAPALLGRPTSVCINIMRPEAYCPDSLHGGWILTPAPISATGVAGMYGLIEFTAAAAPYITIMCHVRYICDLTSVGQFIHMAMDYIQVAIIAGNPGPSM